jgi:hypothetical protein
MGQQPDYLRRGNESRITDCTYHDSLNPRKSRVFFFAPFLMSLYQFSDLAEVGVVGGFEDFEECHFGAAYACAFGGDFIEADLLILQCAR